MSALVFLAPGFEEIEGITVIDILRRAEIHTVVAGIVANPLQAARLTRHLADVDLAEVDLARDFEIVVVPGGGLGAKALSEEPLVGTWLQKQAASGGWIGAVCAGPTVLQAHGVLPPEARIIAHPSVHAEFPPGQIQSDQRVVVWRNYITGLAAGAAMEFSYEIVRQLRGEEAVTRVNQGVLAPVIRL